MMHESGDPCVARQELYDLLRYHLIPNMRKLFILANPEEYERWQGNACRQCAMMTAYAASKVNMSDLYQSKSESWFLNKVQNYPHIMVIEAEFSGFVIGDWKQWTHAWTHLDAFQDQSNIKGGKRIQIDMSHQHIPPFWERSGSYPIHLNPVCKEVVSGKVGRLPWEDMLDEHEYYTGLTIRQIYKMCLKAPKPNQGEIDELRRRNLRQITRSADTAHS